MQLARRGPWIKVTGIAVSGPWPCPPCACSSTTTGSNDKAIVAVGAENQYANVIAQLGGRYVEVTAIMSNPNTDPHSFEASPGVARGSAPPSSSFKTASSTTPS